MIVKSYAAFSKDTPVQPYELERRPLRDDDVLIRIRYAGICHSDIHVAHSDWGPTSYPLVPGHEIVGDVEKVGKDVQNFRAGDCVAVGCMIDSCGECDMCLRDVESFCAKGMTSTYGQADPRFPGHTTAGGYSQKIVVQQKFVLTVPQALQTPDLLPGVAPILCAGITTYSPLRQYGIGQNSKVAVVGLGGLGHMGVKIAGALGAEVTVISRSHAKDSHAYKLGAHKVLASSSEDELTSGSGYFDLVLDTIPFDHDVNMYLSLLKPFSTLVLVGHLGPLQTTPLNTVGLVFGGKKISGSLIGGIKETQELLDLCAEHRVISDYEMIKIDKVNEAWKAMEDGTGANRYIIDIEKFQSANL